MPKFLPQDLQTLPNGNRFWWVYGILGNVEDWRPSYTGQRPWKILHIVETLTYTSGLPEYKQFMLVNKNAVNSRNLSFERGDRIALVGHVPQGRNETEDVRMIISFDTGMYYYDLGHSTKDEKYPLTAVTGYSLGVIPKTVSVKKEYERVANCLLWKDDNDINPWISEKLINDDNYRVVGNPSSFKRTIGE